MAEKVHYSEGPWGWTKVSKGGLVALACTAPHDCDVPDCPGPANKRKLEAFDDLLAACLAMTNLLQATIVKYVGNGTILTDAEWDQVAQARSAIAKTTGKEA